MILKPTPSESQAQIHFFSLSDFVCDLFSLEPEKVQA